MNTIIELKQKELINISGGVGSVDAENSADSKRDTNQKICIGCMVICTAAAFVLHGQIKHHDSHRVFLRIRKRVPKKQKNIDR